MKNCSLQREERIMERAKFKAEGLYSYLYVCLIFPSGPQILWNMCFSCFPSVTWHKPLKICYVHIISASCPWRLWLPLYHRRTLNSSRLHALHKILFLLFALSSTLFVSKRLSLFKPLLIIHFMMHSSILLRIVPMVGISVGYIGYQKTVFCFGCLICKIRMIIFPTQWGYNDD